MPGIRDLICRAEKLEAHGFHRRAATLWRQIVTHPEAPADRVKSEWKRRDDNSENRMVSRAPKGSDPERIARERKIRELVKGGMPRALVAQRLGVKLSTVYDAFRKDRQG